MMPQEVVSYLSRWIVGQHDAKRALAIALRNRWRRMRIKDSVMRDEIIPKNILMIGPTGCGKTEVARRMAKLLDAPFIKVEATKFTEVGFHGRDVDQIIRDLLDISIQLTKQKLTASKRAQVQKLVTDRLLDLLIGEDPHGPSRETFRELLLSGQLDSREVELVVPESTGRNKMPSLIGGGGVGGGAGAGGDPVAAFGMLTDIIVRVERGMGGGSGGGGGRRKRMTVEQARPLLEEQENERAVSQEEIVREAIVAAENDGIVFIDEIDKIARSSEHSYHGADASSEGVQRDLLPIIEGSVVSTRHGNVDTSKILFICSGAFHSSKPSDLLAELQGRLPIRVELKGLTENDLYRILTEPESNLLIQQVALLATEGVHVVFRDDAVREIARCAAEVNSTVENIGARRLHTIVERVVEDISFDWSHILSAEPFAIDADYVRDRVQPLLKTSDLSRFVL